MRLSNGVVIAALFIGAAYLHAKGFQTEAGVFFIAGFCGWVWGNLLT